MGEKVTFGTRQLRTLQTGLDAVVASRISLESQLEPPTGDTLALSEDVTTDVFSKVQAFGGLACSRATLRYESARAAVRASRAESAVGFAL